MENGSRKADPFAGTSAVLPGSPVQPRYRSGEG